MPKKVMFGKTERMSFARSEEIQDMPNLLEIQKNSYRWFLEEGLREVFKGVAAISDYSGNLELSFIDYSMNEKPKRVRFETNYGEADQMFTDMHQMANDGTLDTQLVLYNEAGKALVAAGPQL